MANFVQRTGILSDCIAMFGRNCELITEENLFKRQKIFDFHTFVLQITGHSTGEPSRASKKTINRLDQLVHQAVQWAQKASLSRSTCSQSSSDKTSLAPDERNVAESPLGGLSEIELHAVVTIKKSSVGELSEMLTNRRLDLHIINRFQYFHNPTSFPELDMIQAVK